MTEHKEISDEDFYKLGEVLASRKGFTKWGDLFSHEAQSIILYHVMFEHNDLDGYRRAEQLGFKGLDIHDLIRNMDDAERAHKAAYLLGEVTLEDLRPRIYLAPRIENN